MLFTKPDLDATPVLVSNAGVKVTLWEVFIGAYEGYLQMYDEDDASKVTVGTTEPKLRLAIPRGTGNDKVLPPQREANFNKGLVIACTSTRTGSSSPSETANVNLIYFQNFR